MKYNHLHILVTGFSQSRVSRYNYNTFLLLKRPRKTLFCGRSLSIIYRNVMYIFLHNSEQYRVTGEILDMFLYLQKSNLPDARWSSNLAIRMSSLHISIWIASKNNVSEILYKLIIINMWNTIFSKSHKLWWKINISYLIHNLVDEL